MKKALIYNDTHFPFQDDRVLDLIYKFAKYFKPDIIVHAGDLLDCYPISSFTKDALDSHTLMDEIRMAKKHLEKMRKVAKERFILLEGNHSKRISKYLDSNAKELADLTMNGERIITLPYLLELNRLNIEWQPMIGRDSMMNLNALHVGHFNKVSKHSAYTAKALVEEKGVSIVQAHVHRMGKHYKTNLNGVFVGVENGCTCDLNPSYVSKPNWQHGFSIVYLDDNGKRFQLYDIPIIDYEFMFGGKRFEN